MGRRAAEGMRRLWGVLVVGDRAAHAVAPNRRKKGWRRTFRKTGWWRSSKATVRLVRWRRGMPGELARLGSLTVYTQDDRSFPETVPQPLDDTVLGVSHRLKIEIVPTLIRFECGREVGRTHGWDRGEWERLSGVAGLGHDLPEIRPGCGAKNVEPAIVRTAQNSLQRDRPQITPHCDRRWRGRAYRSLFGNGNNWITARMSAVSAAITAIALETRTNKGCHQPTV